MKNETNYPRKPFDNEYALTDDIKECIINSLNMSYCARMLNDLAIENLVIRQCYPGDKIDIESWFTLLDIKPCYDWQEWPDNFCDSNIIHNLTIVEQPRNRYEDLCFTRKHRAFFQYSVNAMNYGEDNNCFNNYRKQIHDLFIEIIRTKLYIEQPTPLITMGQYNLISQVSRRLLNAIVFDRLRKGTIINDYMSAFFITPDYIMKLCQYDTKTNNYILFNDDIFSLDFLIAIISSFQWSTAKITSMILLKIDQWYKNLRTPK